MRLPVTPYNSPVPILASKKRLDENKENSQIRKSQREKKTTEIFNVINEKKVLQTKKEYKVSRILDHRIHIKKSRVDYLVEWAGQKAER
jgi:hypothetical protein